MKSEQVSELYYRLETIKTIDFNAPPSIEGDTPFFHFCLDNGKLTIKLKQYFTSVEEARHLIDDFLRSWEIDDSIRHGAGRIKFIFYDAKIIDLNDPNKTIIYTQGLSLKLNSSGEIKSIEPCYPDPPDSFKISPDVETLWNRYEGYLNSSEPLQSMAYFCLTLLECRTRGRRQAGKLYKIDYEVLDKLGILTSENKGTERTARKLKSGISPLPLSAMESGWIKAAVRAIIRRVGEINTAPSIPIITMNDLPKL